MARSPLLRMILLVLGWLSLILGVIGIFLPVLPTTPFLILTAWCFLRSSEKAHAWMYRQPYIAKILNDWHRSGAINPRAKTLAMTMISTSLIFIWIYSPHIYVKIGASLFLMGTSTFILTRPSR